MASGNPRKKRRRLKKDLRLERKEKKIGGKEQVRFLGEEIESRKLDKQNKEADAGIKQLYAQIVDANKFILGYAGEIDQFLKTNDPKFTQNAGAYTERITKDLSGMFSWFEWAEKFIKDDVKDVKTFIKDVEKENKLLEKEARAEKKQFRNLRRSAREGEKLDEDKKEAIIAEKNKLNQTIKALNDKLLQNLNAILKEVLEPDVKEIEQIRKDRKQLKNKWGNKATNWQGMRDMLREIYSLMSSKVGFVQDLYARNRKVQVAVAQNGAMLKEKEGLYSKRKDYDKEYESFQVKEQVEMGHEKHMADILKVF
ncbi:hypothetical protein HZC30_01660 [Candidatus Woesearchaeota archaeon]|nr:hypothetical protein [Candidatus Woesearchaeota archaeon]